MRDRREQPRSRTAASDGRALPERLRDETIGRAGYVNILMAIDTKHEDLQSLRIDRSQRGDSGGEPPAWARRYILGGIAVVVLLGLITLAYRAFSSDVPEVEVVRAAAETSGNDAGGTVLSATGYIVAHHTINVNSKVTGPPGVDRRGEGRQGEGRPGAGSPGGSGIPRVL